MMRQHHREEAPD